MSKLNYKHFTLGVEEEYMVLDPQTRELKSHEQRIVQECQKIMRDKVKAEMHQAVVEVGTYICKDIEEAYKSAEFQHRVSELTIVVQTLPRQSKVIWPKIPEETHEKIWLQSVPKVKDSDAVNKVWDSQHDQPLLRFVGNHVLFACEEVNVERALFWLKWLLDEDKRVRKTMNGLGSLTSSRRSGLGGAKVDKSEIGFYIAAVLAEAYKDLARRGLVRMHEEFQELLNLWRGKQTRLSAKQKQECLAFMILVITEVPRWKVPAAQPLIKDPTVMSRAVQQSVRFFQEILEKSGNLGNRFFILT